MWVAMMLVLMDDGKTSYALNSAKTDGRHVSLLYFHALGDGCRTTLHELRGAQLGVWVKTQPVLPHGTPT